MVWDRVGDRVYETGLDKGVLYLPDGSAVPWNGLTSIIEKFDKAFSPVYYDGMKINDFVVLGDFSASMKAVTYPDEFVTLEGFASIATGVLASDQKSQTFGLCYRTQIGNDLDGDSAGYKIHILYNVTAIPNEKTYASLTADPSLIEFEWNIVAIPEEIPGIRPTAHFIINSLDVDPWLLEDIEEKLYGSQIAVASLIPMPTLISFIKDWYRVKIIDNGDGTWTAISQRDGFINLIDGIGGYFEIVGVNAVYSDEVTYQLSDTISITDVPQIKIIDNYDGTWTATTSHNGLIVMTGTDLFEIRNANANVLGPTMYQVSDTTV